MKVRERFLAMAAACTVALASDTAASSEAPGCASATGAIARATDSK